MKGYARAGGNDNPYGFDNPAVEWDELQRNCRLVADPETPVETLRWFAGCDGRRLHPFEEPILVAMLCNPKCPKDVIEVLRTHPSAAVRERAREGGR